jgi:5-(aminomethyl)-3-furanmethanol phosphate kinase
MRGPVVVKVGGSLLDWPALADRLTSYLDDRRGDRLVLVVGGGRFADALRDLDRAQAIGEARSHALALRVLDLTAHALAAIVPGLVVVDDIPALPRAWETGRSPILAPRRFLDLDDGSPDPLPHAWTTTTDAIAARLAVRLGARELVLLKSAPIPPGLDLEAASRLGLVDAESPRVASGLPIVACLNLRDPRAIPTIFQGQPGDVRKKSNG